MSNENRFWRDSSLGTPRDLELSGGPLRVFEAGKGEPIVFVHGALVNANLWRKVVPILSPDFHCVTLDLPLGSHELPVPGADLSPYGIADMIAEAVEALGLDQPTIVANDSGGGLTQIALGRHPELAGRVVLTSCDAYDNFPPTFFKVLLAPARIPWLTGPLFAPLRIRPLRSAPFAFGWLMKSKLDPLQGDSFMRPVLTEKAIAKDFARFMRGFDPKFTLEAIERLRSYDRPVLIAWSQDDRFFPTAHAERLAGDIPGARLEWIEDAYTFSMQDQPERLADLVAGFVREPVAVA